MYAEVEKKFDSKRKVDSDDSDVDSQTLVISINHKNKKKIVCKWTKKRECITK